MEVSINNTSNSEMIHRVPIKIGYKAKGVIRTKNLTLEMIPIWKELSKLYGKREI